MKRFLCLLPVMALLMALPLSAHANRIKKTAIQELFDQRRVAVSLHGLGGYQGFCVSMNITNLTGDSTLVWVEPGRRLDNTDPSEQDILVVKEALIVLGPRQTTTAKIYGFCCQASNHAPHSGSDFKLGSMADSNLVWLAGLINTGRFSPGVIQNAVWVFSNGHNLASVEMGTDKAVSDLRRKMAKRMNIMLPWYDLYYQTDTATLFSGKHYRLTGEFTFSLPHSGLLSMTVRDSHGLLMRTLHEDMVAQADTYHEAVDINIRDWPKGDYNVDVFLDGRLIRTEKITL